MSTENKNSHKETKLFWFSKLLDIGKLPVFRQLGLLVSLVFIRVAPEIPISLKKSYSGPDGLRAGIIGFVLTFVFAFLGNVLATYFNGTLFGDNDHIIYFVDDWWNIILYTTICPLYVGLTCWLVVIVIKSWNDIYEFKNSEISKDAKKRKFKLIKALALGSLILSVAFLSTTNYINDILALSSTGEYYWFLTEKDHELRAVGIYYFLLNFSLLIVTLIAITFFMSIYKLLINLGKALAAKEEIGELEFETLKKKLSAFTEGYIVTKGIIAVYIINIWLWADSPIGKGTTVNLTIALVLLTIIGFFLVSFPRYFVELQWFKLKLRSPDSHVLDKKYEDLRTFEVKLMAQVLDWIFIGGFAFYAIKKVFEILTETN